MKQKCKRLFTLLLAVALLVTGLPAIEAKAAEYTYSDTSKDAARVHAIESGNTTCGTVEQWLSGARGLIKADPEHYSCTVEPIGSDKVIKCEHGQVLCKLDNTNETLEETSIDTLSSHANLCRAAWQWSISQGVVRTFPYTYGAEWVGNELKCVAHGFLLCTRTEVPPTPSTSKKEAPTEPITPAEEIRAAEEEAFPLTTVETDKTGITKEEVGLIPDKTYNLSAYATTRGFVSALEKIVKANPKEKSVSIFTGKAFTFNKGIVEAINKGGKEVVYYFNHAGHLYSITVPATVDAAKVLEKGGHAGPLYVGKVLGTTRLIK